MQIFDITTDSKEINEILNSGVSSIQREVHWTKDDKCLVLLEWAAKKDWIDPRGRI